MPPRRAALPTPPGSQSGLHFHVVRPHDGGHSPRCRFCDEGPRAPRAAMQAGRDAVHGGSARCTPGGPRCAEPDLALHVGGARRTPSALLRVRAVGSARPSDSGGLCLSPSQSPAPSVAGPCMRGPGFIRALTSRPRASRSSRGTLPRKEAGLVALCGVGKPGARGGRVGSALRFSAC